MGYIEKLKIQFKLDTLFAISTIMRRSKLRSISRNRSSLSSIRNRSAFYRKQQDAYRKKHVTFSTKKKDNNTPECIECGSTEFIKDIVSGHPTCVECGVINMSNILDSGPEWKNYHDGKNEAPRCSKTTDPLRPKSSTGFGIKIAGKAGVVSGWGDGGPYEEKSLSNIFETISFACEKYNIRKIIMRDAQIMCRMISQKKYQRGKKKGKPIITRGKNRAGIIAASVFFACKRAKEPRSTQEVAKMFKIEDKALKNGAKNFYTFIKINNIRIDMGTTCSYDFIQRKCDELKMHRKDTRKVMHIARNADRIDIASTHTSYSLAASCILLGSKIYGFKGITIEKISACFDISKVTINKTHGMIKDFRDLLMSDTKTKNLIKALKRKKERKVIPMKTFKRMQKFGVDTSKYTIVPEKDFSNEDKVHDAILKELHKKLEKEKIGSPKYIEIGRDIIKEYKVYNDYLNQEIKISNKHFGLG